MSEQSSRTSLTPAAFFHPDDCSLRMSQATLLSEAPPLLERLPDWGFTADGALYPLPKPAHHTCDADGFSSPILPTPTVQQGRNETSGRQPGSKHHSGTTLQDVAYKMMGRHLLPTPVVNDMGAGKTVEKWDAWTAEQKEKHRNGNGHGKSLSIEVQRLLPTPQHWDHKVFSPNVDWKKRKEKHAESVASVIMNLLSDDGNESSDGQHLTQLTIEDCDPSSSHG